MSIDGATLKLVYTCADRIATRSSDRNVYYYVFNIGENNGFVIVSGDDRAKDILGYSDGGSFDINFLPPNFVYWLDCYKQELQALMEQPDTEIIASAVQLNALNENVREATYTPSVAPLLGGIKWDQRAPYNDLCPIINTSTSERAATGCGATAMAQIMRYHKWPVSGTGSNTYTPEGFTTPLSVDFSQTTYDWVNMPETYNSTSTAAQKNAVATLMYHAGVAASMNYGIESVTPIHYLARALINNFGYDSNLQIYERNFYSMPELVNLIKTELNAKRPVIFSGESSDKGHAFICDGYDSDGLYHFNWGWSGLSDGYFELSALNPLSLGTGGGTIGGYNNKQCIVIGVQKPSASSVPSYQIYEYLPLTASAVSVNRTDPFSVSTELHNRGINNFNGVFCTALCDESGIVGLLSGYNVSFNSYTHTVSNFSYPSKAIPASIANGNYKLYSLYKATGQSDYYIMRGKVGTPNYLNVSITSSTVSFSTPDIFPKLTLNSLTVTGNLYQNKTGRFNVSVTNAGGEYNSNLVIYLKSVTNGDVTQFVSNEPVNIPSGETKSYNLIGEISLAPGQYYLSAMYDPANDRSNLKSVVYIADPINVNVLAEPTVDPSFALTAEISFPDNTKVNKNNAVLTAHIKNSGGYFDDDIVAFVYPLDGANSLTYFGLQKMYIETNEEKTITFTGQIHLEPGSYRTAISYWNPITSGFKNLITTPYGVLGFTLVDYDTGLEQTPQNKLLIYPTPAIDNLYIKSGEVVKTIRIMDLSGKQMLLINPQLSEEIIIPVERLSAGVYILQLETATGMQTCKFIKK
ncbi:hypothetical protein BSYN_11280 [Bacteroides sedimenti]|uniref:T9SS type A sorting domain-containing protein n=2 Tax=Bacteroides sedimenti TaxID=2136147 RepID=A0ABN6Z938_9BACE